MAVAPLSLRRGSKEPLYEYLLRLGAAGHCNGIYVIERLLTEYPIGDRARLIAELSQREDQQFLAAIAELTVYSSLRALGLQVDRVEERQGFSTPDFQIFLPDEGRLIVEVKSSLGDLNREQRDLWMHDFLDRVWKKVRTKGWGVFAVDWTCGKANLRENDVAKFLDDWLRLLDRTSGPHETVFTTTTEWAIEFAAYPCRDPLHRPVSFEGFGFGGGTDGSVKWIRDSVRQKLDQHKEHKVPTIVALVNFSPLWRFDDDTIGWALVGSPAFKFSKEGGAATASREQDGFWYADRARSESVVGVLVFSHLVICELPKMGSVRMWWNPRLKRLPFAWHGPHTLFDRERRVIELLDGPPLCLPTPCNRSHPKSP